MSCLAYYETVDMHGKAAHIFPHDLQVSEVGRHDNRKYGANPLYGVICTHRTIKSYADEGSYTAHCLIISSFLSLCAHYLK